MNMLLTPEQIAVMPAGQQTLLENTTACSTLAFLLAVSKEILGCLAFLFKIHDEPKGKTRAEVKLAHSIAMIKKRRL